MSRVAVGGTTKMKMNASGHMPWRAVLVLLLHATLSYSLSPVSVQDPTRDVTYQGVTKEDVDYFYGIHYAEDTSGANRFHPPIP